MTQLKTRQNNQSVVVFLKTIDDPVKRKDCNTLKKLMREVTGKPAKMWGSSIVGFGSYHYKYASGREGEYLITGFSPRKQNLVIYIMPGFSNFADKMKQLGKYKTGKSCLYIKSLDHIDLEVLQSIVADSVRGMHKMYACD
jgi:hypothetical protein